ncbi:MAG TPA: SRPBCC domain-containing protein [Ktedonobacterales bacterium]|jgi:carbon monoxide dehydrogenase subunit G|nr:SRPBCC domain-containing protein [Ktedonobacterales bacterium]
MRVEGTYTFPGAIGQVFAALINPDALARAIPGCERFIQLGPTTSQEETAYEARLRLGQHRQPYTIALTLVSPRRPAYARLELRGHGPAGPITGSGSLDLVEQDSHTVVAYRFTFNGAELPEVGDLPSQSASFIARATCAHLADEIYAQTEEAAAAQRSNGVAATAGAYVTARGRIVTRVRGLAARRAAQPPLAWAERAIWMSAGLAMGLGAIALAAGIVRRFGAHDASAS